MLMLSVGFKWLALVLLVMASLVAIVDGNGISIADEMPLYKFKTKRDNDRIEVKSTRDKVIFDVHSPFGISEATITRTKEAWPKTVVLRLHLSGLESFQVSNGKVSTGTSVPSVPESAEPAAGADGKKPEGSLALKVRPIGKDGQPDPAIPLKEGYMEIELPEALFEGNPPSLSFSWIDFYRV